VGKPSGSGMLLYDTSREFEPAVDAEQDLGHRRQDRRRYGVGGRGLLASIA
jgi:hypothetical protein